MFVQGAQGGISNIFPWRKDRQQVQTLPTASLQPWMPSWHLPGEELLALAHPSPFTGSVPAQLSLLPYSPRFWHRQGGRLTAHCRMEVPPSQLNSAGNSLEQLACRELFCRSQFPLRPCTACEREEVLLKTSKTIY